MNFKKHYPIKDWWIHVVIKASNPNKIDEAWFEKIFSSGCKLEIAVFNRRKKSVLVIYRKHFIQHESQTKK
jgi:hypothetical protein